MSDTSLLFNFLKGRDTVSPHTRRVSGSFLAMASSVRASSIIGAAAMVTLVAGIGGLIAHAIALTAALAPMLNTLSLIPAVVLGAAAGIGTLMMSFRGLGAAMQRTASGGGGAASSLAAGEKRIAAAQKEALRAQNAINEARRTAADRLRDVTLQLARAKLDEKSAVLAVAEAERELTQARRSRDPLEMERANIGYQDAVLSLEEVRARLEDVTEEEAKRRKAGVEGSEEVREAVERHREALDNLKEAQDALNAGGGGGGIDRAAEAYARLSQAGKQLVDVLLALKPRWEALQRVVQQATLAGVARDVQRLADVWFPVLRQRLVGIGGAWNVAFRGVARLAASRKFVRDIDMSLGSIVTFLRRLGASWAPVLSGLRHFTVVGSTFLPGIGSWILRLAQRFDAWAEAARRTGRMHGWISKGLVVLRQFWDILKNLGASVAAIFRAGNPAGYLASWVDGTRALREWLESAEGQQKMAGALTTLRNVASMLVDVLAKLSIALLTVLAEGTSVSDSMAVLGVVAGFLADHLDELALVLPYLTVLFLGFKTMQAVSMATAIASIPVTIFQTVVMWKHTAALRANTAAMAMQAGTTKRGIAATIAYTVAKKAAVVWSRALAVAQFLLGTAMKAIPIFLIITLIIGLVTWIVHLWKTNENFRKIVIAVWNFIWQWLKRIGAWFAGPFVNFFKRGWNNFIATGRFAINFVITWLRRFNGFVASIPGRIAKGFRIMWNGLVAGFKIAVNAIIRLWNNFRLTLGGGEVLGMKIPSITLDTPNIPYLDTGGRILQTGIAVVHKGETVVPAKAGRGEGIRMFQPIAVRDSGPVVRALVDTIMREVKRQGGKPGVLGILS